MKAKKILALAMSLMLISLFALASCSSGTTNNGSSQPVATDPAGLESSAPEDTVTVERQVLRVGMECAYAPFNWSQESDTLPDGTKALPIKGTDYYAYGYDVMVAQKIAEILNMDLEIYKVEWASIGLGLDVGDYDCIIAGMGYTPARAELYEFTSEYYLRGMSITVNANGKFADVTKLSDFEGLAPVSITQMGTAWVDALSEIPGAKLGTNYETTAECFMAVSNNVADLCLVDSPTSLSAAMTDASLKILEFEPGEGLEPPADGSNRVCIASKKGNTALRDMLQSALNKLEWDEVKMNALMEKAISLQPSMG